MKTKEADMGQAGISMEKYYQPVNKKVILPFNPF